MNDITIYKTAVIGFLVLREKRDAVYFNPISVDSDGVDDTSVESVKGLDVVGVLPAPAASYKVYCFWDGLAEDIQLGYEFGESYHPDWQEAAQNWKLKEAIS